MPINAGVLKNITLLGLFAARNNKNLGMKFFFVLCVLPSFLMFAGRCATEKRIWVLSALPEQAQKASHATTFMDVDSHEIHSAEDYIVIR